MRLPETLFMILKKMETILFLPRGSGYINYSIFMWCNAKKEVELMEKKNYPLHG